MGFSIYYRSTKEVTSNQMRDIEAHATELNKSRTWLSCEPVSFRTVNGGDHLLGGSKPNLEPHPDDIASAATEDLPDGTVNDLFDVLAQISVIAVLQERSDRGARKGKQVFSRLILGFCLNGGSFTHKSGQA